VNNYGQILKYVVKLKMPVYIDTIRILAKQKADVLGD